jgi:hypothetical protein
MNHKTDMIPGTNADDLHRNDAGDGMSMNMPAIFISSTTVTLFFSSWTTTSTLTCVLALSVLFSLAFLNRFLAALRFQLQSRRPIISDIPILRPPLAGRYGNIPKARLSPLPAYMRVEGEGEEAATGNGEEEAGLVSETAPTERTDILSRLRRGISRRLPSWMPSAPWNLQGDGAWALLEGFRAFVGYIL